MGPNGASREPRQRVLLNRRQALGRVGAGSLLALGLWPGSLRLDAGTGEPGAFRFIAVNDTHFMSAACGPWLERAVRQMRGEGAEFCLLCGDLTERGGTEHLATVRDIFRELKAPVYAVPGNHDYVEQDDRRPYEKLFPRRLNYRFEHRGWQFVGLDTTEGQLYEKTNIQPATFGWLDRNLRRLDPRQPTVLFTHFPLGEAVKYRPGNAEALLERFRSFNLQGIFSGHWHGYTLRWLGEAFAVTGQCCALRRANHDGSPARGYLVCEARAGNITYRFAECRMTPAEEAMLAAKK
jgi:predicted MPP superfamily phosphohydrolase